MSRRKQKKEAPIGVLECQSCNGIAVEIYGPVICFPLQDAHVLCPGCFDGDSLVVRWRFILGPSLHPIIGAANTTAHIRYAKAARNLDMTGCHVTLLP